MGRFKHLFLVLMAVAGLLLGGCGSDNNTFVVAPYNGKYLYVNNNSGDTSVSPFVNLPNYVSGFAIKSDGSLESLPGSPFATGGVGGPGTFFRLESDSACFC